MCQREHASPLAHVPQVNRVQFANRATICVAAIEALDDDFVQGRYVVADVLWRATLKRAGDLSRQYTRRLGCRSLDILHVASALELQCRSFLTFDVRQQQLARAVKLRMIVPA